MTCRVAVMALAALLLVGGASAQQPSPRDVWPQAAGAASDGDLDSANRRKNELLATGRSNGLKTYPTYAASAAALARSATTQKNRELATWSTQAADQLDPKSPAVTFSRADEAAARRDWAAAVPLALSGFARVFSNSRTNLLGRADLVITLVVALALTVIVFALALFVRYGRSIAHDFRELLAQRLSGGSVTVLAFALLFLPLFLWLGPMWLVFYWLALLFGYASLGERIAIVVLCVLAAFAPIALDLTAHWVAGVDSTVVMAARSSAEQSYQPEALRRMQELVSAVPDNPTLHVLLGNLQLFEGNDEQAAVHYRRAVELRKNDAAGAHVNLGNLHFLNNDFAAALTEYGTAQQQDKSLAIAFYNASIASGETYKFTEQARFLEQARDLDRGLITRLTQSPPPQKVVMYHPPIAQAWAIQDQLAAGDGAARILFGNYSRFDPLTSALNPITIGSLVAIVLGLLLWLKRRRGGFAGACIKCGRTFCHRCKSARESATYCTQCIHIYLKRDGVSLDTKRKKVEEVSDHHRGMLVRNRFFATFLPGAAQVLEGRTFAGTLGMILFSFFIAVAIFVGRLAPALGPSAEVAQLIVRATAILLAVIIWIMLSLPVYRRKTTG
ncbi:MAG TPA: tetratricopeptide repeat protein [Thermoanaerobaculia bacterium]|jgi:tetratricopeptide (TPR) repeat protein